MLGFHCLKGISSLFERIGNNKPKSKRGSGALRSVGAVCYFSRLKSSSVVCYFSLGNPYLIVLPKFHSRIQLGPKYSRSTPSIRRCYCLVSYHSTSRSSYGSGCFRFSSRSSSKRGSISRSKGSVLRLLGSSSGFMEYARLTVQKGSIPFTQKGVQIVSEQSSKFNQRESSGKLRYF